MRTQEEIVRGVAYVASSGNKVRPASPLLEVLLDIREQLIIQTEMLMWLREREMMR